ncbi:MAG: DapH/DapD/GlmU-related protein [Sulfurimonadaceae bacterium]
MSSEFIPFLHPLSWDEIDRFVQRSGIEYIPSLPSSSKKEYQGLSDGRSAEADTLCFVDREPTDDVIKSLREALVITTKELHQHFPDSEAIYTEDPRALFIKLIDLFDREKRCAPFTSQIKVQVPTIDPQALIDERAIIEEGVSVGKGSVISAGSVLKRGTVIGENCIIRENCTIGCNGIALYKTANDETLRFPHLAGVQIGDNVELGAGAVIVRGTLANTVIEDDSVIGNLCNIGHGVKVGQKVWMSVGSLIGGNCTIGNGTTIGLGVRLRDNLTIGEDVSIGMGSVVTKNLPSGVSVFGNPAKKLRSLSTGPKR